MKTCLYYLSQNPKYYRLLQAEVDAFYKENNLTEPITYLQTQQIPMLQAVVKEAIRLLPPILFQLLRYAPDNFKVRGHYIPAGTPVGISAIAQNRDPDIWGDDADDFHPERWLENDAKAKYFDSSTMTFGGNGTRMCVGRNIALVRGFVITRQLRDSPSPSVGHYFGPHYKKPTLMTCRDFRSRYKNSLRNLSTISISKL